MQETFFIQTKQNGAKEGSFTGNGTKLSFSMKMRMRTDATTGAPSRFEAALDGCHVG